MQEGKAVSRNYEKRRFIEAASMAILHASISRGLNMPIRDVVNRASELFDELEVQVPNKENDRD